MHLVLNVLFLSLILNRSSSVNFHTSESQFYLDYQWTYINFTWESPEAYIQAILSQKYIPQNNAMSGVKYYNNRFYLAMPRRCIGTPATLGYFDILEDSSRFNRLITPFPNWESNDVDNPNCDDKLENVQSMEIDADGIMWVIDGFRITQAARCPTKLVLFDLNNNRRIIRSFTFPEEISLSRGGFLNDIVVDQTDGTFAYITDASPVDPGLIVYSIVLNFAWKLRDTSMYAQPGALNFVVDGIPFTQLVPIDGIALSPNYHHGPRYLLYSSLTGVSLFAITTDILKNQTLIASGMWRFNVTYVGDKQAQGDGMIIDNRGDLYYGLLPLYAVGRWNIYQPIYQADIVDQNFYSLVWPDSFCFDDNGYLYVLANNINTFDSLQCMSNGTDRVVFRLLKKFTGTRSYLYQ